MMGSGVPPGLGICSSSTERIAISRSKGSLESCGARISIAAPLDGSKSVNSTFQVPPPLSVMLMFGHAELSASDVISTPSYQRVAPSGMPSISTRSEEHTSELQSRPHLVCRLLLEKK